MLYIEEEVQMGDYWHSFCKKNLGKKYQQWMVPCRILNISPAEYVRLLVTEYNAIIHWSPEHRFLGRKWVNHADQRRWRLYINKKARERNFQI